MSLDNELYYEARRRHDWEERQERLDKVRVYYFVGKRSVKAITTKEEINEAIKRVKEHMRSMTAKDIVGADKYWQFIEEDE